MWPGPEERFADPGAGRRAFTLVEVAVALAVISFALIGMLGLILISLNSSKDASHDTEIALASEYSLSMLTTNTYANLADLAPCTNYFDSQGAPTTSSSTTDSAVFNCVVQTTPNLAPFAWSQGNTNCIAVKMSFTWPGQGTVTENNAKVIWTSISAY